MGLDIVIQSGSHAGELMTDCLGAVDDETDRTVISASRRRLFDVHVRGTCDVAVLTATGALDALAAPRFRTAVEEALAAFSTALIVDLSELTFLSSAGLAILQDGHQSAGRTKQFLVVADGPATSRPMKLIGLDRKLVLYPTLDDALNDVR